MWEVGSVGRYFQGFADGLDADGEGNGEIKGKCKVKRPRLGKT